MRQAAHPLHAALNSACVHVRGLIFCCSRTCMCACISGLHFLELEMMVTDQCFIQTFWQGWPGGKVEFWLGIHVKGAA